MRCLARYLARFTAALGVAWSLPASVALAALPAVLPAVLSAGVTHPGAPAAITVLNRERAANGIPADLTENVVLSHDCALHDAYMAANRMLTHSEVPGNPSYSPGGAYAGAESVLSQGPGWAAGDPFATAPLHLDQLLAPRLLTLGSADTDGYSCTTTFPGWTRADPAGVTIYTDPGPDGVAPAAETAAESPFTPGQLVGIAAGAQTGPYLTVLVDAPGQNPLANPATLSGASLTGPAGAVAIATVDGTTALPSSAGGGTLAGYISPGGFIIPRAPLLAGTTYHAHVVVGFAGVQTSHDWTFTTAGADAGVTLVQHGARLTLRSASPATATVTFVRDGGGHAPSQSLRPGQALRLRLSPGTWTACASQPAHDTYSAARGCLTLTVTGVPVLALGRGELRGGRISFPLRFSAILRGRAATLSLHALESCASAACPPQNTTTTVHLDAATLSVPFPAEDRSVTVSLGTAAFSARGARWSAATARASFDR